MKEEKRAEGLEIRFFKHRANTTGKGGGVVHLLPLPRGPRGGRKARCLSDALPLQAKNKEKEKESLPFRLAACPSRRGGQQRLNTCFMPRALGRGREKKGCFHFNSRSKGRMKGHSGSSISLRRGKGEARCWPAFDRLWEKKEKERMPEAEVSGMTQV